MKDFIIKTLIVSKYTFIEIFKSRIMINVIILGFVLCGVTLLASELTYGVPQKITLDLGLGMLSLSMAGMSIFIGSTLMAKEIETRTIYSVLSRKISRNAYYSGRVLGMVELLFLNTILLGSLILSLYLFTGGKLHGILFAAILFTWFEAVFLLLLVSLFSLVTNVTMSIIYTICLYILGHALSDTIVNVFTERSPLLHKTIKGLSFILPNFSKLNLKDYVIYNQSMPASYYLNSTAYFIFYGLFLLLVALQIFKRKNLN